MSLNHDNLQVKYKSLLFRNKRIIYVIKVKINSYV